VLKASFVNEKALFHCTSDFTTHFHSTNPVTLQFYI